MNEILMNLIQKSLVESKQIKIEIEIKNEN